MVRWHNFFVNVILWIVIVLYYIKKKSFFAFIFYLFHQGRKKLVEVFRGMCSRFCACISSLLNVKTQVVLRNRKLLPWSNFFWSRIWIKVRRNDFNPMIMYDQSIIEELPFILLNNSEQIASCIIIDNWFQFYGTFLPRTFIKER